MRRIARLAALVAVVGCGSDSPTTAPSVLDGLQAGTPKNWFPLSTANPAFVVGVNRVTKHGGEAALEVVGIDPTTPFFHGVSQSLKADAFRGKRVRLSAWVRHQDVSGRQVGLFMRVDGQNATLAFDGMATRSLRGTSDWHQIEIVLDFPNEAIGFQFGFLMGGSGVVLVDDILLEVVPANGPTTETLSGPVAVTLDAVAGYANLPTVASNLDFEAK